MSFLPTRSGRTPERTTARGGLSKRIERRDGDGNRRWVYDIDMAKKRATTGKPKNPWPARVQALLERYQLTQKQLGSRLGLTHQNISQFVRGTRIPPRPVQLLMEMMENGNDLSGNEK